MGLARFDSFLLNTSALETLGTPLLIFSKHNYSTCSDEALCNYSEIGTETTFDLKLSDINLEMTLCKRVPN